MTATNTTWRSQATAQNSSPTRVCLHTLPTVRQTVSKLTSRVCAPFGKWSKSVVETDQCEHRQRLCWLRRWRPHLLCVDWLLTFTERWADRCASAAPYGKFLGKIYLGQTSANLAFVEKGLIILAGAPNSHSLTHPFKADESNRN